MTEQADPARFPAAYPPPGAAGAPYPGPPQPGEQYPAPASDAAWQGTSPQGPSQQSPSPQIPSQSPPQRWADDAESPFAPAGVTYRRAAGGLITARLITTGIVLAPLLLGSLALAILVHPVLWALTGLLGALLLWLLWLIPRQVRAIGYAERDDDLLIRKGILFRQLTVVPYGRMQFVDVKAGPLMRAFGIAQVQLHTASATTDASIPGLSAPEAERLRDRLTERGEAKLAGL